jgi:hypothetical protein
MNDINQKKEKSQGKMFKKQHKAQKWTKVKRSYVNGSP